MPWGTLVVLHQQFNHTIHGLFGMEGAVQGAAAVYLEGPLELLALHNGRLQGQLQLRQLCHAGALQVALIHTLVIVRAQEQAWV